MQLMNEETKAGLSEDAQVKVQAHLDAIKSLCEEAGVDASDVIDDLLGEDEASELAEEEEDGDEDETDAAGNELNNEGDPIGGPGEAKAKDRKKLLIVAALQRKAGGK